MDRTSPKHGAPSTISLPVETARIADLLQPFLATPAGKTAVLSVAQLNSISTYIDLLLRWNARINLTSVRQPEAIVTRHFGESLFAAQHLFPKPGQAISLIDIGSGAGFPGVPIKLWAPQIHLTLIESNHKKVAFLRQLARTLTLTDINVFPGRAETYAGPSAGVVTLRAVERFSQHSPPPLASSLPEAGSLSSSATPRPPRRPDSFPMLPGTLPFRCRFPPVAFSSSAAPWKLPRELSIQMLNKWDDFSKHSINADPATQYLKWARPTR